ncbi:hypothetical protein H0H81_010414 [Sphagnurus paluster]|uniref:XPG-I domain-containing protein n=1 Tax=Sphagnurus paluster TaxID=117069 RepID=A0A9P7GHZ0_9AGAR|nr:hypothetical protein H0H81_010414 [Sphagnurus paluster]
MVVSELWNLLQPIEKTTTLQRLAVNDGFIANIGDVRALQVGINASAWIYRVCSQPGGTRSGYLLNLFAHLHRLLVLPILPLFVFDGPGRPRVKWGKKFDEKDHELVPDAKTLFDNFAFPWMIAPGEADAELAWMSRAAIIDIVLSEDSNTIVFGAKAVLRVMTGPDGQETMKMYESADMATNLDLKLELCDLVLIAILGGGDYDPGLDGCDASTAFALAHAGLGKSLIHGIQNTPDTELHRFLGQWRAQLVAELTFNSSGFLSQKQPTVAASVPANFPDINIIHLYTHPLTSEDAGPSHHPSLVTTQSLDLPCLVKFAEDHFTCTDHEGIYRIFASFIFPGLAVRQLMSIALSTDLGLPQQSFTMLNEVIAIRCESESSGAFVPEARVRLLIDDQILRIISDGRCAGKPIAQDQVPESRVWLPVSMIQHVQPGLLAEFAHRQQQNAATYTSSPRQSPSIHSTPAPVHTPSREVPHEVIDLTRASESPPPGSTDMPYPTLCNVIDLTVLPEVALPSHNQYRVVISVSEESGNEILEFITDSEGDDEEVIELEDNSVE